VSVLAALHPSSLCYPSPWSRIRDVRRDSMHQSPWNASQIKSHLRSEGTVQDWKRACAPTDRKNECSTLERYRDQIPVGSCWIEGEVRIHQHPKKLSGHALEVVFLLEDGHVLGQILLVNPAKAAQKIAQPCPDSAHDNCRCRFPSVQIPSIVLLCTSLKPSPSASRAHSPSEWLTDWRLRPVFSTRP